MTSRFSRPARVGSAFILAAAGTAFLALQMNRTPFRGQERDSGPTLVAGGGADDAAGVITIAGCAHRRVELQVNSFTAGDQGSAALDAAATGGLVVAWASRRQEHGTSGVYCRAVDWSGLPGGGERHVNQTTASAQGAPAVACDGSGGTWIVWQSFGQDGDRDGVFARHSSGDGVRGAELRVNTVTAGSQNEPAAASFGAGGLAVVWTGPAVDLAGDAAARSVFVRFCDGAGRWLAAEQPASADSRGRESCPSIAASPSGGAAVVWQRTDVRGRSLGIFGQCFDARGRRLGGEWRVDDAADGQAYEPGLAAGFDGGWLVTWLAYDAETDFDVRARAIRADGRPVGPTATVNHSRLGRQNGACAAAVEQGFMVLWNTDVDERTRGIRGRLVTADGKPVADEFTITEQSGCVRVLAEGSGRRRAVGLPGGGFACAWYGDGGTGDASAAFVSLIQPPAAAPAERQRVQRSELFDSSHALCTATGADTLSARPHEPPTYDPLLVRQQPPFGGDAQPYSAEGEPIAFLGTTSTGWTPPDPEIAVGPNHVVIMTNGLIRFYTKTGTPTFSAAIEGGGGFWGAQGATGFVFDPETTYDEGSGRFFAMACERTDPAGTGSSYFLLAVSDDSDPNGMWHKYRLNVTMLAGGDIDSPNLSVGAAAVFLTADFFTGGDKYLFYMLKKADLLAGAPSPLATSLLVTGTQSFGLARKLGDAPAMYLVENLSATTLRLHAVTNALTTPTRVPFDLAVPSYGYSPEDPPQAGGSVRPETFDSRFWSCEWRNGSLWAVHHQNSARVITRWYEIHTNGWPTSGMNPTLAQSGSIDPGSPVRTFFPAIAGDDCGNAVVVYARSSPSEFISMWSSWRHKDDPPGAMRPPLLVKASTAYYGVSRWGDYGGIEADPEGGDAFWLHHEYTPGGSTWNTWIATQVARPKGDMNGDDAVTAADLPGFVAVLLELDTDDYHRCTADMNRDGAADGDDVPLFVERLIS